jgi:hypothetical protein
MDITHLDIDKLISARAKAQTEELSNRIKRLEFLRKQTLTYDNFSDWAGHIIFLLSPSRPSQSNQADDAHTAKAPARPEVESRHGTLERGA